MCFGFWCWRFFCLGGKIWNVLAKDIAIAMCFVFFHELSSVFSWSFSLWDTSHCYSNVFCLLLSVHRASWMFFAWQVMLCTWISCPVVYRSGWWWVPLCMAWTLRIGILRKTACPSTIWLCWWNLLSPNLLRRASRLPSSCLWICVMTCILPWQRLWIVALKWSCCISKILRPQMVLFMSTGTHCSFCLVYCERLIHYFCCFCNYSVRGFLLGYWDRLSSVRSQDFYYFETKEHRFNHLEAELVTSRNKFK